MLEAFAPLFFCMVAIISSFFGTEMINELDLEVFLTTNWFALWPLSKKGEIDKFSSDPTILDHAIKANVYQDIFSNWIAVNQSFLV